MSEWSILVLANIEAMEYKFHAKCLRFYFTGFFSNLTLGVAILQFLLELCSTKNLCFTDLFLNEKASDQVLTRAIDLWRAES